MTAEQVTFMRGIEVQLDELDGQMAELEQIRAKRDNMWRDTLDVDRQIYDKSIEIAEVRNQRIAKLALWGCDHKNPDGTSMLEGEHPEFVAPVLRCRLCGEMIVNPENVDRKV